MDFLSNKAIMIGVSLFITIAITSGVLLSVGQIKNIYKEVYETNTNIDFDEFEKYDNGEFLGIDVKNTVRKYTGSNITSRDTYTKDNIKIIIISSGTIKDSDKYISTLSKNGDNIIIKFEKK